MKTCEVHGVDLQNDRVEVRGGFPPAPPEGYFEAKAGRFPHANSWVLVGCVIDVDSWDDREEVDFCLQCRLAEKQWFSGRLAEGYWIPE